MRGAAPTAFQRKGGIAVIVAISLLIASGCVSWILASRVTATHLSLEQIDQQMQAQHPSVPSITPTQLTAMLKRDDQPILIDVREPAEYAVSHIAGAIRVDDNADADEALAAIAQPVSGREVILYCSVGVRSTLLAERIRQQLTAQGAAAITNLSGGLFAWHNARLPLVNGTGEPTDLIHPYDREWGQLVQRQGRITYRIDQPQKLD